MYIALFISILFLSIPSIVSAQTHPVINEFSVHPSTGNKEWVEFFVADGSTITNYWLDDDTSFAEDAGSSGKKSLTEIVKGYDAWHQFVEISSVFNNSGDSIVLFDASGTLVDHYTYTSDPGIEVTIGRFPNGTGEFQTLAKASKGESNSPPAPTATPTPSPTTKPTPTPKPTKAPKESTATKTSVHVPGITSGVQSLPNAASSQPFTGSSRKTTVPSRDYPTPVLGVSTSSAKKKEASKSAAKKMNKVLVKDIRGKNPALLISLLIGGGLLLACGILIFLKQRSYEQKNK